MTTLGSVAKAVQRAPSKSQDGRGNVLLVLSICAVLLLLAVLHESGAIPTKSVFARFFSKSGSRVQNTEVGPIRVTERAVAPNEIDDSEDIERDEEIEQVSPTLNGALAESSSGGSSAETTTGKGPHSQIIRDKRLLDGYEEGDASSSRNGEGIDGGGEVNFNDVLSSLEDDDDAVISSGMISGVRVQAGVGGNVGLNGGTGATGTSPTPTPDPNETPRPWVTGQARGYTMLYAMHPRARNVVEAQINTLLRARVREPYIGVLIDGTFSRDFEYLRSIIDRLSQDGRRLKLVLYLTNGPVMRRFETTKITAPFSRIDPIRFRSLIRFDSETREQFSRLVNDAARVFRYNLEVHQENTNVAVVMLEDNLDFDSYNRMRSLASRPLDRLAIFARSPCIGCYSGNNGDPQGDVLEEHNLAYYSALRRGDGYSFDGVGFSYPGQVQRGTEVSSDQLLELMRASVERGLQYVGLWRAPWQGISDDTDLIPPDQRDFIPPTSGEQQFEIRALREGLSEEVQNIPQVSGDDDLESNS